MTSSSTSTSGYWNVKSETSGAITKAAKSERRVDAQQSLGAAAAGDDFVHLAQFGQQARCMLQVEFAFAGEADFPGVPIDQPDAERLSMAAKRIVAAGGVMSSGSRRRTNCAKTGRRARRIQVPKEVGSFQKK